MSPQPSPQPSVFAHRPFALFWASRVLSTTGFQMQSVAVGWLVYELTGSALDLGLVGLAQFVPMLVLALVTGHVADNFDRRRIVVACQAVKLLTAAALGVGSLYGAMPREAIFALIFVFGAARAFEMPTLQALLPGVVPEPMLTRAVAASASANQAATIAGPALGGLLYAASPMLAFGARLFSPRRPPSHSRRARSRTRPRGVRAADSACRTRYAAPPRRCPPSAPSRRTRRRRARER